MSALNKLLTIYDTQIGSVFLRNWICVYVLVYNNPFLLGGSSVAEFQDLGHIMLGLKPNNLTKNFA